ncbi:4-hydroxythreonine-4-phosphate dehydrogenase PdxA [Faecalibacter sp. LW9]|uniref:4-hydroxythreonine-4-phosphate dehydrogenase PdxA n=1 Tax=Faecalibacter sp. LW9 TaxID=3103144 RepID=UPI002AFDECC6|nr:4-hydroxythreonine-4-phosphate dehydrogenase PdxA [Faecalibacter sp. LW9]
MSEKDKKIRVAISIGDFNGIGIEVILKTLKEKEITEFFTPVIFGSTKLLSHQKDKLKLDKISFQGIHDASQIVDGKINVVNLWKDQIEVQFGKATKSAGEHAFQSLKAAAQAVVDGHADVLVTAPINKDNIQSEEFNFPGHTEYLGEVWGGAPLMFMVSEKIKVGLVTQHVPISKVAQGINKKSVYTKIQQIHKSLVEDYTVERPKIAVLGLNPHAGDNGLLGSEEQDIILPAIERCQKEDKIVYGPYSADSFFTDQNLEAFDAVLAMYHDQGLIPFKTIAFDEGVNYTAGLKYVRTSPDHGVAYDIAGKGIANEESFKEAVFLAIELHKNRLDYAELTQNVLQHIPLKLEKGDNKE